MKCLVVYSSRYGQTEKIAVRIADTIRSRGAVVDVWSVREIRKSPRLEDYDVVVAGSPVYYARHCPKIGQFVRSNLSTLNERTTALFSVSLSASGNSKQQDDARRCVDSFLRDLNWSPSTKEIFGGGLPYRKYGWITRMMMKWIASKEGGDTDTSRDHDYTDWVKVDEFAFDLLAIALANSSVAEESLPGR